MRPTINFFESAENLLAAVKQRTGRSLSAGTARDAAICIQQGRLFFEAGEKSGLEIRPLELFYGSLATARALALIKKNFRLSSLTRSHGLRDISSQSARIEDLAVRIDGTGTFQDFNDAAAEDNCVHTNDATNTPVRILLPASPSTELTGLTLTIKDILARVAELGDLYALTFQEELQAQQTRPMQMIDAEGKRFWAMQVTERRQVATMAEAVAAVQACGERFPVLQRWTVSGVVGQFGKTTISFRDEPFIGTPVDEQLYQHSTSEFYANLPRRASAPLGELLEGGSLSNSGLSAPVQGKYVCTPALVYLGIFLLSSLVRYRPEIWIHAISRLASHERPADDKAIALIEKFLGFVPRLIQRTLLDYLYPNDMF